MEDQGKRVLLAVGLALGVMIIWQYLFPPPKPPPPAEVAEETEPATKAAPAATPQTETPPLERAAEETVVFSLPKAEVIFSSWGGGIKSWRLLDPRYVDQKTEQPLNMVPVDSELGRALRVEFPESTFDVPSTAIWSVVSRDERSVAYQWASDSLRVTKEFSFRSDDYSLDVVMRVENLSKEEAKQSLVVSLTGQQDPDAEGGGGIGRVPTVWVSACFAGDDLNQATVAELEDDGALSEVNARWVGMVHSYFLAAIAADGAANRADRVRCGAWLEREEVSPKQGVMHATLRFPSVRLQPGDIYDRNLLVYMGPKYLDDLEALSASQEVNPRLEEAVDLGWLAILARPLLWLLKWFQSFVVNWGLAIILLTVTVKLGTLYWTHKSMVSMQDMAKLKPQLEKLKEKYPDDQERQRVETMNLFKAHNVNPMASCLPMLLQMPIWFALYRSLTVAAELYRAPFVNGWIEDLTAPDPLYILPVAVTAMMFLQSRLTPQTATGPQQKMMQYGMPLMFGVFSFFFPAGLTLYIFTNTVLSAGHHLYIHKSKPKGSPPAAVVVAEAAPTSTKPEVSDSTAGTAPKPGPRSKKKKKKKKRKS